MPVLRRGPRVRRRRQRAPQPPGRRSPRTGRRGVAAGDVRPQPAWHRRRDRRRVVPDPFVVLMAGVGAVFGGLAGTVNGTIAGVGVTKRIDPLLTWVFPSPVKVKDLLPTTGAQIGGI